MKKVIPFSLSEEVVERVREIPRGERSRRVNDILRRHLLGEESAELRRVKEILRSLVESKGDIDNTKEKMAISALDEIVSMRD